MSGPGGASEARGVSLVSPENAAALDREASADWGLSPFALVEAAGRACAQALASLLRGGEKILVCAGPGNNGADALVMLRALLNPPCFCVPSCEFQHVSAAVLLSRFPADGENSPRSSAVKALAAMGVPVITWNGEDAAAELFAAADIVIDGIAGTGLRVPLEGVPLEMVRAINKWAGNGGTGNGRTGNDRKIPDAACSGKRPAVVSVDVPSGAGEGWKTEYPAVRAAYTLAVEPQKTILYTPALRPLCGKIIPVTGIFPQALLEKYGDAELLSWETQCRGVPAVSPDAYKYSRGTVEIHAGSPGSAGAARIAAAGACAAGAGLVRLIADDELCPVLACAAGGTMVVPESAVPAGRFKPHALLLGPGWGRDEKRRAVLRQALEAEKSGTPLVLDADGIGLLPPDTVFHGRAILTPHAGELAALSGIPKERLLSEPGLAAELARKYNAVILFKGHVTVLAGPGNEAFPGGRTGFIDGMDPALGAGGSGDLLAGFCAAIAGRMKALEDSGGPAFDPWIAAAAAGTLLAKASRSIASDGKRFYDPLELAGPAAALAGSAWLP